MAEAELSLQKVAHSYFAGAWQLEVKSFVLRRGRFIGIIGPNGSGKSTLLKLAAGVLTPAAGEVRLNGIRLGDYERRDLGRLLGYLPQEAAILFDYTVEEVAAMGRYPHASSFGGLTAQDGEAVHRALELTDMLPLRQRNLSQLSGGERKRALLASALAQEPALMLLDEPTASLDFHHQTRFFRLARTLVSGGMGMAVATHDINVAAMFCDHLMLMHKGIMVCEGTARDVLRESLLRDIYGPEIIVASHPADGTPILLPRRSGEGER